MLLLSCWLVNSQYTTNYTAMKKAYTKKQIVEAIAYWQKQLKSLDEGFAAPLGIEELRGRDFEEFEGRKDAPSYDRWFAAQLPDPDEGTHGTLPSAAVVQIPGSRDYLKDHQVYGIYPDGELFELGPYSSGVCREYISLHKLSKNSRSFA